MMLLLKLLIFLNVSVLLYAVNVPKPSVAKENVDNAAKDQQSVVETKQLEVVPELEAKDTKHVNPVNDVKPKISENKPDANKNVSDIRPEEHHHINATVTMESGAVFRGVLLFVGVAVLFVMYLAFKTYRRKNRSANVRKYGIRARRSDIEMTPLPLDEEEDDETVFDLGTMNRN